MLWPISTTTIAAGIIRSTLVVAIRVVAILMLPLVSVVEVATLAHSVAAWSMIIGLGLLHSLLLTLGLRLVFV